MKKYYEYTLTLKDQAGKEMGTDNFGHQAAIEHRIAKASQDGAKGQKGYNRKRSDSNFLGAGSFKKVYETPAKGNVGNKVDFILAKLDCTDKETPPQEKREMANAIEAAAADTAEKTRATTAEGALKAADTTEKTRATTAEGALKAADTTEVTNRNTAIATEVTARDTAIGSAIGTEVTNRDTAIATEVTNRNTAIATEVTARDTAIGSAIGTEVTNRNTAIATETARALAAETAGSSFSYSMTCGLSGTDACKIGAVGPGGGWIFFVDYNNQYSFNYLEVAPTEEPPHYWCNTPPLNIPSLALPAARALGPASKTPTL